MTTFGKKNLVDYLWFNSSLSNHSDYDVVRLACLVSDIRICHFYSFGNLLVYSRNYGEYTVIDDEFFKIIKEL